MYDVWFDGFDVDGFIEGFVYVFVFEGVFVFYVWE